MEISQIPVKFIFHSYSESSTFGWPGHGRSIPNQMAISLIPTLATLIWFLLWELIIWQTRSWHIYPPIQWWFHRFLLWQLTTLRAQHLADQFLADVTPHIRWQIHKIPALLWKLIYGRLSVGRSTPHHMAISQISALTAHISFLLWQLHIWQTRSWQIYPPSSMAISQIPTLPWELIFGRPSVGRSTPESNGNFTDCCSDSSYFIPTLRAQYFADKVFADLPPCLMAILQIPVKFLFHSFSKSSSFGRPCPDRSSPIQWWFYRFLFLQLNTLRAYHLADQVLTDLLPSHQMAISQINVKFIFHSYSESTYLGRPSGGRSTPCQMAILQIAALTAHISFLLWELIIWQTRSWQIYPPSNGNFTDSCSDSSLL